MYFEKENKEFFKFDPSRFNFAINHGSNKIKYSIFLKNELSKKGINAADVKKNTDIFLLTFFNKSADIARVVNYITNNKEVKEKDKDDFFYHLYIYLKQFYNDHELIKKINTTKNLETLVNACYQVINRLMLETLSSDYNPDNIREHTETLNKIYSFYDIVAEFMVRYYGYTIRIISNIHGQTSDIQGSIITAKNIQPKEKNYRRLEETGYTLYKLQRARFIDGDNPHYEFDRVIPTEDMGYYIDEYIEASGIDDNPKNKRLIKVPNSNPKHPYYKKFFTYYTKTK